MQSSTGSTDETMSGPYQLFMLGLSLYALGALVAETFARLSPETLQILRWADTAVCVLFFADFVIHMVRSRDRWGYFVRWGWIDLLSSIPMVDALRFGRAARVLRIIRVLRAVRSARVLTAFILARRAEGSILAAALVSLLLVIFGSIAVLQFEQGDGANIRSPSDAVWWAVTTITTVGYGDRFPVTTGGRFIAVVLMAGGVGLFGAFSGFVASWFLAPGESEQNDEVQLLRKDIAELRALLERDGVRGEAQ